MASLSYSYDSCVRSVAASINLQFDYLRQAARSSSSFYWQEVKNLDCLEWRSISLGREAKTRRDKERQTETCMFLVWSPRARQWR